jgi:hypothetical protein
VVGNEAAVLRLGSIKSSLHPGFFGSVFERSRANASKDDVEVIRLAKAPNEAAQRACAAKNWVLSDGQR